MAVKLLDVSSLTRELGVLDDFSVMVKYTPRPALTSLIQSTQNLPPEDAAEKYADQCIGGWVGLTPALARRLNVPLDDAMAAADGKVPYAKDVAGAMWLYAYADKFSTAILNFSWQLLEHVEKEKAEAKNGLGGSPPPSPTP